MITAFVNFNLRLSPLLGKRREIYGTVKRLAVVMLAIQLALSTSAHPVLAQPQMPVEATPIFSDAPVSAKERASQAIAIKREVSLAALPNDVELQTSRLFAEQLIPMATAPSVGENEALGKAITAFKSRNDVENLSDLTAFLAKFPNSRWRASLELNLGLLRNESGYFSDSLAFIRSAWKLSKDQQGQRQQLVAQRAGSELVLMQARLGRPEELRATLAEVGSRPMLGSSAEKIAVSKEALFALDHAPKLAYKCGPYALDQILRLSKPSSDFDPRVKAMASSEKGTSLGQLKVWSDQLGLNLQAAKRAPGAPILQPAVIHFRAGHYAAITGEHQGRYRVQDPTFSRMENMWLSARAIDAESDGFFLVPAGQLPAGWQRATKEESQAVWGKGIAFSFQYVGGGDPQECSVCPCPGMASASMYSAQSQLNIQDTPLSYSHPFGGMDFVANYNQNEAGQPAQMTWGNLGPNWNFSPVSWITFDASRNATIHTRGGGIEVFKYSNPDNLTNPYPPSMMTQAKLTISIAGVYQRESPDGSIEVYNLSDGLGNVFLTQLIDPQGNVSTLTYDADFRLVTITDPNLNVTNISYFKNRPTYDPTEPGFYIVSSVTDPFGRSASFSFDSTFTYLQSITDAVGIVSRFNYDTSNAFITSMETPYGKTFFKSYTPEGNYSFAPRGLRFTYPDGTSSQVETWLGEDKSSYFWDRHALSLHPADPANHVYSACKVTRWILNPEGAVLTPIPSLERKPLEAAVNYAYSFSGIAAPTTNLPASVSRVLSGASKYQGVLSGGWAAGDVLTLTVVNPNLQNGQVSVSYKALPGDFEGQVAIGIAAAVTSNSALSTLGVTASADGSTVTLNSSSAAGPTFYLNSVSPGSIGTMTITLVQENIATPMTVGGTVTAGDILSIVVIDPNLPGGTATVSYQVQTGNSLSDIAQGLVNALNASTVLDAISMNATAQGTSVSLATNSATLASTSISPLSATETITTNVAVQRDLYRYNAFGKPTLHVDPSGRTTSFFYAGNDVDLLEVRSTQGGDKFLLGKWQYNSQHMPTVAIDGSGRRTQFTHNVFGQVATSTDPNSVATDFYNSAIVSGTVTGTINSGDVASITVIDSALSGGQQQVTFTAGGTDTQTTFAAGLASAVNNSAPLQTLGVSATSSGNVVTVKSNSLNKTTFSKTNSGMTLTLSLVAYGFLTAIRGKMRQLDITNFAWDLKGTLASVTNSQGYKVDFSYDNMDRLISTAYPDATTERVIYKNLDPVFLIDRLGRTTQRQFDAMDQLAFEIDPLGRKTEYTWCDCGSLASLKDGKGQQTQWQHDLQGRVTKKIFADSTDIDYVYEGAISRLSTRTDALSQVTTYLYNVDNTLKSVGYTGEVNPTSDVQYVWDSKFLRLRQAQNGWGNYQYAFNDYTSDPFVQTLGGGRLNQISNSVIPAAAITFEYDSLGRTTKRKIDGANNEITWSYDAMSRVTQEVNALGTFGYTYLDNGSGVSKGDTRLASISYPNSQVTNFSWFDNLRDQGLREISNLNPSSQVLSQFGYAQDSAGQITRWTQRQQGRNQGFSLDYDSAGQLTGAVAGRGVTSAPLADQYFYGYDPAANRTAVQTSQVHNLLIGGTKTTGDVITVNVNDSALSGGTQQVQYTVLSGDTLSTIATNLAATITATASLQGQGIDAVASGTVVTLRSKSPNVTTYSTSLSGGATETVSANNTNPIENITIGGTAHQNDALQVIVRDPALSGGQTTVNYTVPASPTLNGIASGLATAINGGTGLSTLGVTATAQGRVVTVKSTSQNLTSYTGSVSGTGATTTMSLGIAVNGTTIALLSGTATQTDVVSITVFDRGLTGGSKKINYTVGASETPSTIASGLATNINNDTDMQGIGVSASASGTKLSLVSVSISATSFLPSTKNSLGTTLGTEKILLGLPNNGTTTAAIAGTVASGDQFTLTIYDAGLTGGSVAKIVTTQTTPNSVAIAIRDAINNDTSSPSLGSIGVTATAATPTTSVSVVNVTSTSNNATTYTFARTGSATIALGKSVGVSQATFNNVNELTGISAGGATKFQGTTDRPVLSSMTVDGGKPEMSTSSSFSANPVLSSGSESVAISATAGGAGGNTTTNSYKFEVVGASSATLSYDANGNMLSDGTNSFSWDAENRLLQITYPGTGNNSQFVYDPLGRNVRIDETTGGGTPTVKQFVWCGSSRCEERDGSGTLAKRFFDEGQLNGSTKYFYVTDHLHSVRDMTDNSGLIQAQFSFDPYGRATKIQGTVDSDFGFAGYYVHGRSGLNLPLFRVYSAQLGRWISRDPLGISGGSNQYNFCGGSPANNRDELGLYYEFTFDPKTNTVTIILPIEYKDDGGGLGQVPKWNKRIENTWGGQKGKYKVIFKVVDGKNRGEKTKNTVTIPPPWAPEECYTMRPVVPKGQRQDKNPTRSHIPPYAGIGDAGRPEHEAGHMMGFHDTQTKDIMNQDHRSSDVTPEMIEQLLKGNPSDGIL